MASSNTYIHKEKASFISQFIQSLSSIFGVKKIIEKSINKGKFKQDVASVPKSLKNNFDVNQDTIKNRKVWTIRPKTTTSKKVVLYLHGGAYYWNISKYNWSFTENLLAKTNAIFVVPDYPLAPEAKCDEVYDFIGALYDELLTKHSSKDIIFMGESAGGSLALGFAISLRDQNKPQPSQLILLAPWLDATMSNPDILKIDKNDKILGIKGLQMAGKGYAGQLSTTDYKISPINGNLLNLGKISVFVGTHDLFLADVRKLKDETKKADIAINYYEYPKMFHIWILVKQLKEAQVATNQIASLIKNDVQQSVKEH